MSTDPARTASADSCSPQDRAQLSSSLERLRTLLVEEGGLMSGLVAESPADGITGPADGITAPDGSAWPHEASVLHGSPGPEESLKALPPAGPAQLAASGPRVHGRGGDYELLLETIYEGYLLHYHAPRVVRPPEDDLALLAGDRLYALGLARLVKLGDIEAVAELADMITLSALAHGGSNPELAAAVWMAGARAVGWGTSPRHDRAKALTRAGSPDALEAMRSLATA